MNNTSNRIIFRALMLAAAILPWSPPAFCGEQPRLQLLARDSYLPGIPLLLRIEHRTPDGERVLRAAASSAAGAPLQSTA